MGETELVTSQYVGSSLSDLCTTINQVTEPVFLFPLPSIWIIAYNREKFDRFVPELAGKKSLCVCLLIRKRYFMWLPALAVLITWIIPL